MPKLVFAPAVLAFALLCAAVAPAPPAAGAAAGEPADDNAPFVPGPQPPAAPHAGLPAGLENIAVRFIRLEYAGGDWDRNLGPDGDYPFLLEFARLTGFTAAPTTESIPVAALHRFPPHRAPPFVYLTGSGNVRLTDAELASLRWYCLEQAGLLFADCGGPAFDKPFRTLMARAFPELAWEEVANDDVLFQAPFLFPNGAPPLWHHAGRRALGLRHAGRWLVFYHPGSLGDAWKTGHSGAAPLLAAQACKLGTNVVHYAFCQYTQKHAPDTGPATPARAAAGHPPGRVSRIERVLSEVSYERPAGPAVQLDPDLTTAPDDTAPRDEPATRAPSLTTPAIDTPLSRELSLEPD
jgi:hypothetical protein